MKVEEMQANCKVMAEIFKILSHPQRLMILCLLTEKEMTVSELQELTDLSQSQLSQFLNYMKSHKILDSSKKGHFVIYKIIDEKISTLLNELHTTFCKRE